MWLTYRSGPGPLIGRSVEATGTFVIGRDPACDLLLQDERVSRRHAELRVLPEGGGELHDLGSANGTFVDGRRVTAPRRLYGGEMIRFGSTELQTSLQRPPEPAQTVVGGAGVAAAAGAGSGSSPTPSTIERLAVRRSLRTAIVIGSIALVGLAVAGTLLALNLRDDGGAAAMPAMPATTPTAPAPAPAPLPTIAEIVNEVRPSTVLVQSVVDGQAIGSGTGWVLDAEEGHIVTNAHVVNGGETFEVGVDGELRDAELVASAPCEDLALLEVEDSSGLESLPLGDQSDLEQGDRVIAVGFPGSASEDANLSVTTGVVSVVDSEFDLRGVDVPQYPNVIQTDAAINPGNSGGPLLNDEGELVGVNSAGITTLNGQTIQGQGYAIGVDRVRRVLRTLTDGDSIGFAGLGLEYVPDPAASPIDLDALGLPSQPGLLVVSAVEGSPAHRAGFGDEPALIVAINGEPMDGTLPTYCDAVGRADSGESATYTVLTPGSARPRLVELTFS